MQKKPNYCGFISTHPNWFANAFASETSNTSSLPLMDAYEAATSSTSFASAVVVRTLPVHQLLCR